MYLKGEKYLLKGRIHVESNSLGGVLKLPEKVVVDILNNEGAFVDSTTARFAPDGDDQSINAVYEYSIWANAGEKLILVPQDSRYTD